MRVLALLLLLLTGTTWADPLVSKIVARLPSPDGHFIALQRNSWERWGPGPEYPVRCEILLAAGKRERKLHEFVVKSKLRRQYVQLQGWEGPTLLVSHREAPFQRMSEDAVSSLRSSLWHMSANEGTPARPWKRGVVKGGGIMDVGAGAVCLGLDGEVGGGAGYPPYLAWKTLEITDLEGQRRHLLKDVEANDNTWGARCLSPDGHFVAAYTVAPSVDVATLVVRAVDGSLERKISTPGIFRWTGKSSLELGSPPRGYDVFKGQ